MPFGSGGGSFRHIYPSYEDPEAASPEYINHAHDDYAELALEYGAPGALLAMGALGLWAWRMRTLWAATGSGQRLARAGCAAVGIVLLHSLVDYPARTAAIAVLTAFAAALMAAPSPLVEEPQRRFRSSRSRSGSLMVMIDDL
jgi:O-antigen ligase